MAAATRPSRTLALLAPLVLGLSLSLSLSHIGRGSAAPSPGCVARGEALCNATPGCAAFGVYDKHIQLHGCTAYVPNTDWAIFEKHSGAPGTGYTHRPGVNVNNSACATQPSPSTGSCAPPPPPPPPPLYDVQGTIDVFTYENTIFYWHGMVYNLENIPCKYWDHAGIWDPSWGNNSYARVRELVSGRVVSNITLTKEFGFVSAFPDYEHDTLWLFGTPANRCHGNGTPKTVQGWSTKDLVTWNTSLVFNYGLPTHNVQVTRVGPLPGQPASAAPAPYVPPSSALPPHRYVMFLECFTWAINNNADGDLSSGWVVINSTAPKAPCGGPSMRFNPADGHYYILTGGHTVSLLRTRDFQTWTESTIAPFIAPAASHAAVASLSGFPAASKVKGSPPNAYVGVPEPHPRQPFDPVWKDNWKSWVLNSNDGDICCIHADVNTSYVVWGGSTQGRDPQPPLDGTDAGVNVVATADMPLTELLQRYFD